MRSHFRYALLVLLVTLCDLAIRLEIKIQLRTDIHFLKLRFDFTHVDGSEIERNFRERHINLGEHLVQFRTLIRGLTKQIQR